MPPFRPLAAALIAALSLGAAPALAAGDAGHAMMGDTAADLFPDPQLAGLARAACKNDAAGVAEAVKAGANPNAVGGVAVTDRGRMTVTPLLWALDCKAMVGVAALLDAGAKPNQAEPFGATPVTVAAGMDDPTALTTLLRRGGDANADDGKETALEIALRTAADLEDLDHLPPARAWAGWEALLAAGADPNRTAPQGQPLANTAAVRGRFDKLDWLLDHDWKGDPVKLGRTLETTQELGSIAAAQRAAFDRVKTRLVAMGVRFPIGPLNALKRDARGFYVQP